MKEHDEKNVLVEDVQVLSESPRALLVYLGGKEHWIPKSQIHDDSEVYERGQHGAMIITKWIAKERGLWEGDDNS
jgi:hypothetical protein